MRHEAPTNAGVPATRGEARVGTAGWSISPRHAGDFPGGGTHLERYARQLPAVEINSSFYRSHRSKTYERWAMGVPDAFRFAVKLPMEITHARRLVDAAQPLAQFISEASALGGRLGPLLVQLPPSLGFGESTVATFFDSFRAQFGGQVVCEPRHPSWFTGRADALLSRFEVARVAADPARVPRAAEPGGWSGLAYYRLHGSPQMYHSAYSPEYLASIVTAITAATGRAGTAWCIFDNTALGEATGNALDLLQRMEPGRRRPATPMPGPTPGRC